MRRDAIRVSDWLAHERPERLRVDVARATANQMGRRQRMTGIDGKMTPDTTFVKTKSRPVYETLDS